MKVVIWLLSLWGYLITRAPRCVFYAFSDLLAFLLWGVVRYRRGVVRQNLARSFPEKSQRERARIAWAFYRHLADLFYEDLLLAFGPRRRVLQSLLPLNLEIFKPYVEAGKSVVVASNHYGNWEMLTLVPQHGTGLKMLSIYKTLHNRSMDAFMHRMRSRFGSVPVTSRGVLRAVVQAQREKTPVLVGLISDQTPPWGKGHYWGPFLNQDTKVYRGVEHMAQQFDLPVFFSRLRRVKRGVYSVEVELITDTPRDCPPDYITQRHVALLEKLIQEAPPYWLWSHKRWKHKREEDEL